MRITVDIDEAVMEDLLQITGERAKSPAVAAAVVEFVKRTRAREFGRMIREGVFDYPAPPRDEPGRDGDDELSW